MVCKWVYKVKRKSDVIIEQYKTNLVILGNTQVEGLDDNETFAPVIKMVTVCTLFSVAAACGWEVPQMDVHNVFLHDDVQDKVYMKLPPGYSKGKDGKVCRLQKSMYELKQALRFWFAKLTDALKQCEFRQFYSNYSLFTYLSGTIFLCFLVYVDDFIITRNDLSSLQQLKAHPIHVFT